MKNMVLLGLLVLTSSVIFSQSDTEGLPQNSSSRMLASPEKLIIGGYGQIDFNQPWEEGAIRNGVMDVHRLVLMFAYKFDKRTSFVTEIELEHVKEVFVEQAFVNYEILSWLNFRGGLMLIPMGIINEYHEPPSFNGVERPNLDKYIVPSTWREIGIGFTGQFAQSGLGYQIYLVNGFLGSDDGSSKLSGSSLLRSGRQKGAESVYSSPNLTFKLNYTGLPGLSTGVSGYFGKSQSSMLNGIAINDPMAILRADSTIVSINMLGIDARYSIHGIGFRGQINAGSVSNSEQYNEYHGSDLGSGFSGYYAEISYNLFHMANFTESQLIPFFRYENYDTHKEVDDSMTKNLVYNRTEITLGLGWKPNDGLMFKVDYQLFRNQDSDAVKAQINAGIGVWF